MLNYFKPKNLIQIINRSQKFVFIIFILILILGLVEALILSPEDYKQSDSVRIMYVHVPAAWISLGIFSLISVLSFGIIIFKNKNFSLITKSLAPSGFVFNISLTDSLAMLPTASVSGLYFSHPQSRYFQLGRIDKDQVEAYSKSRGESIDENETWLSPVLGY